MTCIGNQLLLVIREVRESFFGNYMKSQDRKAVSRGLFENNEKLYCQNHRNHIFIFKPDCTVILLKDHETKKHISHNNLDYHYMNGGRTIKNYQQKECQAVTTKLSYEY